MAEPGLTAAQVTASRAAHGSNVLTPPPRTPWWKQYLSKFDDPVIRILMIAAGVAIAVGALDGKVAEGVGILAAVFLATFLAFWNEFRAAREFDVLNTSSDDVPVKVRRDGGYRHVPKRDVVAGDCVFVEVGEEIPADGALTEAVGFLVNEAKLTGEAVPAEKAVGSKLFRGTTVIDGYGLLTAAAVGDRTEIGRALRESIEESDDRTPLNKQLAALSRVIGVVGFGVAVVAFAALLVNGVVSGVIALNRSEWLFLGTLTVGVGIGLMNVWLPIVYDAFALAGRGKEPPAWLGGGKSWLVSILGGGIAFALLIGVFVASSAIPASPGEWLNRADARQILRDFMIASTIIVVAVPEGLAMSVTLSLAYSMRKMTAENTLVRRMDACETIGAATVICTDKTGTLTHNQMRLFESVVGGTVSGALPAVPALHHRVIEAIAVNSTAHLARTAGEPAKPVGNPTEGALLLWLESNGVDYLTPRHAFTVQRQWIFSTDRKFMATLGRTLHVKGAPEIVLDLCTALATEEGERLLTEADRTAIAEALTQYQSRGMRTLALAYREMFAPLSLGGRRVGGEGAETPHPAAKRGDPLPQGERVNTSDPLTPNPSPAEGEGSKPELDSLAVNLVWLGLVAIADPIRAAVPGAIAACRAAGIEVKIVTGDNAETAREIARQIGLDEHHPPLTGPEFAALADGEASEAAAKLHVLARARPADKLRLVRLLKARGEVVAVTGDGVNDGPALNYADVGLAMGRTGTAVAREASDIVLLDDSFPSIVNAVRWGRSLYENIQRFILFQLTINVVALGLAVTGPFLGYELPLTVMQMLWVNLIMDTFAALALATEPPHEGVLRRPPRSPAAFIVTRRMARGIFGVGGIFLLILIGFILVARDAGDLTNDDAPSRAGTIIFTAFVLLQFWNLFNAKAMGRQGSVLPALGNNPSFLAIAAAILLGQVLIVQFGGGVFRTVPLGLGDWLALLGMTSLVLWVGEAMRLFRPASE